MTEARPRRQTRTREDWTRAALDALATDGVRGVAVDRLAKTVGATRGSFYWHFRNRGELIDAALKQWEAENTTALIPTFEGLADPVERLRTLFRGVYEQPVDTIEIALASTAEDPLVAAAYARVTRMRLDFLRQIFIDLGLSDDQADARAWLAYGFYIGHHQLGQNSTIRASRPARLDHIVDLLSTVP